MLHLLLVIITLLFALQIVKNTGIKRLEWFIVGYLFCSSNIVVLSSPFLPSHRLFVFSLLISVLIRYSSFIRNWKSFPLKFPLFILFIVYLIIGVVDNRLPLFLKIYRPIYNVIETFFVILLAYSSIKDERDYQKLIKFLVPFTLLMTFYGVFIFITKQNPYDRLISSAFHVDSIFEIYKNRGGRFRINSFTAHPITYGFICGVLGILYIFSKTNSLINKKKIIFISILLLINLLLANSRTPLLAFILGLFIVIHFAFKLKKKIQIILLSIPLAVTVYLTTPFVQNKIDSIIDIAITGGEDTGGSNVNMRTTQLAASFLVFSANPIFGHGFDYIQENMGWNSENKEYSSEFRGFESYLFVLLIETGFIGIFANMFIIISLTIYFLKNREIEKRYAVIGLAIITMFFVFSFATGTINSWLITMTVIGIMIKIIEEKKSNS